MSALSVRDVTVRFGSGASAVTAVDHVSLDVERGQVVGLVGESGSGKSTLARAVAGLVPLTTGTVTTGAARRGRVGPVQMIFQDPASSLDPRMSVGASVAEGVRAAGRSRPAEQRAEVARLLELVALDPAVATRRPRELSGGQRQRVAVARALAARPEVLVADEVTSALDVSVQAAVLNLVRELRARMSLSMLFISHDLAVVRYVSDVVAVMQHGRVVEVAPTEQLVTRPGHPYTAALLAAVPVIGTGQPPDRPPVGAGPAGEGASSSASRAR